MKLQNALILPSIKKSSINKYIFVLLFTLLNIFAEAQKIETGNFFVTNYSRSFLNSISGNWAVLQDPEGVIGPKSCQGSDSEPQQNLAPMPQCSAHFWTYKTHASTLNGLLKSATRLWPTCSNPIASYARQAARLAAKSTAFSTPLRRASARCNATARRA